MRPRRLRPHASLGFNEIEFPDVVRDIAVAPGTLGVLRFDDNNYTVDEDAGTVTITVLRDGGSTGTVTVNFSTSSFFGATPGQDFTPVEGTLTFEPGVTSQTFTVPIIDDDDIEPNENFTVMLSSPAGGAVLGNPGTASVTIDDDDDPATSAATLSQAERNALVAALNAGTRTRAEALRSVVEDATFAAREFNRAFVLMQYFGYLRRDPDEPGFNFWLRKLDSFGGDFRAAQMVRAFISSIEYRQRFGR